MEEQAKYLWLFERGLIGPLAAYMQTFAGIAYSGMLSKPPKFEQLFPEVSKLRTSTIKAKGEGDQWEAFFQGAM